MTDLKPADVQPNAFTENLGTDWVAVNAAGIPIARAANREKLEQTTPGCAVFSAEDFEVPKKAPLKSTEVESVAPVAIPQFSTTESRQAGRLKQEEDLPAPVKVVSRKNRRRK